eukprot:COSAG05_NODE_800_length_7226_cov_4.300126_7_plen_54_part_00
MHNDWIQIRSCMCYNARAILPRELPRSCMRAGGAPSFMHARRRSSLVSHFLTE